MSSVFVWWAVWALLLIFSAAWIGRKWETARYLKVFCDNNGRFSLNQFQIVLWTILILSLFAGIAFARLCGGVENPLNIQFPNELLILMGISVGTSVAATAIKSGKDRDNIEVFGKGKPKWDQLYNKEDKNGEEAESVDVTRFQNFWITIIMLIMYLFMAISFVKSKAVLSGPVILPGFNDTLLYLIGISHAGYMAGKLPRQNKVIPVK